MKNILETLLQELGGGRPAVLVTVVASSGSTPRGEGARMVIGGKGRLCGTIGGGAVEYDAEQKAAALLAEGVSDIHYYQLRPNQVQDLGMVCGGNVNVYFQYMGPEQGENVELLKQVLEAAGQHRTRWLVTAIDKDNGWSMSIADPGDENLPDSLLKNDISQLQQGGTLYFAEPITSPGFTYIFGGGHVAQELQPVLSHVDFRCVIFEDRPEFASSELFPTAEKIILGDFLNIAEKVTITKDDFVVVMTRGHAFDYELERQVLATPACYIGVIGSRAKVAAVGKKLMADGFTEDDLKRIYTPIGLDIKSETPAEIAISIAAEMIKARAEAMARK